MSDLLGNSSRSVWDRVSSVSENSLASYLSKEHPQTAALILSKVKPACAAKVMSQLPSSLRNELMRRVLSLKPIVDDAIPYDAVWDCVTCGTCVEACPVLIEHVVANFQSREEPEHLIELVQARLARLQV